MKNKNLFPLERNRYFYGKMLTARDLETEQKYINDKRRIINRLIFGAGVACGLGVFKNDENSFSVETGLALDYFGREIVIESPLIRKLAMIEGYENLTGYEQCYLCLHYDEKGREPVNNIGIIDREGEEFNKIVEGFRLSLEVTPPNFNNIYSCGGKYVVDIIYSNKNISIIQIVPSVVMSGTVFTARYVIVKNLSGFALSFDIKFISNYFGGDNGGEMSVSFNQGERLNTGVFTIEKEFVAPFVNSAQIAFANSKYKVSLKHGDFKDEIEAAISAEIHVCGDEISYEKAINHMSNNLESQISGDETPIYLGKIDYVTAGSIHMIKEITYLPFDQKINGLNISEIHGASGFEGGSMFSGELDTDVYELKYWQKPEVSAKYDNKNKKTTFRFGLPSSEAYDYATSSGLLSIPIVGTLKVNSRFISDEVSHDLGVGDVSVSVSVEFFGESENRRLLFGNGEIFAGKGEDKEIPKIESAVILYPEKGTFKVGVWCHDHVDGQALNIRWFAYKPTRDTADMRKAEKVTIKLSPEIQKIKVNEQVHFIATVFGSADKQVRWFVKDLDGGTIDSKGLYKAPSTPGTYEINATHLSNDDVFASAFVIVEE